MCNGWTIRFGLDIFRRKDILMLYYDVVVLLEFTIQPGWLLYTCLISFILFSTLVSQSRQHNFIGEMMQIFNIKWKYLAYMRTVHANV